MFKQVDYVMVTVSDMGRSVEFYRDKLGIPLRFESPEWSEFETGVTMLALHGGGREPNVKSNELIAGHASIGFYVADLDQTYEDLKSRGIAFVMSPTKREAERIKLAVCVDPDGLRISIAQQEKQL